MGHWKLWEIIASWALVWGFIGWTVIGYKLLQGALGC